MDNFMTRRGWLRLLGIGGLGGVLGAPLSARAGEWCDPDQGPKSFQLCSELLFPNQDDPLDIIGQKLLFGNARYVSGDTISHKLAFDLAEEQVTTQEPAVMVLSCADSRVVPELLFDQPRARLFVCRVAGNFSTAEIVGSLEYGVKVLGARFLVVLGHNRCGAVEAAIALVNGDATFPPSEWGEIGKIAEAIAPAVNIAIGQPGGGSLLDRSINANAVLNAQALAQVEPILAPAVRSGDLGVAAARFDIGTGEVTPLWVSFASI